MVKRLIDPGLEGDAYAEKPYLYGRCLSSVNVLWVGEGEREDQGKDEEEDESDQVLEEGGDEEGLRTRRELHVPDDAGQRSRFFLDEEKREAFELEVGKEYGFDFFNGYLDFNGAYIIYIPCIPVFFLFAVGGWPDMTWRDGVFHGMLIGGRFLAQVAHGD